MYRNQISKPNVSEFDAQKFASVVKIYHASSYKYKQKYNVCVNRNMLNVSHG